MFSDQNFPDTVFESTWSQLGWEYTTWFENFWTNGFLEKRRIFKHNFSVHTPPTGFVPVGTEFSFSPSYIPAKNPIVIASLNLYIQPFWFLEIIIIKVLGPKTFLSNVKNLCLIHGSTSLTIPFKNKIFDIFTVFRPISLCFTTISWPFMIF